MRTTANVLLGAAAAIAISGAALAEPCTQTSYDNYLVAGFSCQVGDKTFSDFSFGSTASGTGIAVTPDQIVVIPTFQGIDPGFIFSSGAINVSVGAPIGAFSFVDVTLDFTVTAGAGRLIHDAELAIAGGVTGAGQATVDETAVPAGALNAVLPDNPFEHIEFDPVASIGVLKDIFVGVAPGATGTANITAIRQTFSQVPEPASLALLGASLLGFGLLRRRRSRKSQ